MCALILDKREVYMKLGLKLCGVVVPELQRRVCEGDVRKASPKLARLREHLVIIYIRSVSRSPEKLQSHTETNRRTFDVRKQTQFHRRAHTQPYYGARFSAVAHRGAILKVSKPDSSVRPSVCHFHPHEREPRRGQAPPWVSKECVETGSSAGCTCSCRP